MVGHYYDHVATSSVVREPDVGVCGDSNKKGSWWIWIQQHQML